MLLTRDFHAEAFRKQAAARGLLHNPPRFNPGLFCVESNLTRSRQCIHRLSGTKQERYCGCAGSQAVAREKQIAGARGKWSLSIGSQQFASARRENQPYRLFRARPTGRGQQKDRTHSKHGSRLQPYLTAIVEIPVPLVTVPSADWICRLTTAEL